MSRAWLYVLAGCGRVAFVPLDDAHPADGIAGLVVRYPMDDDPQLGQVTAIPASFTAPCSVCPTAIAGQRDGAHYYPGTVRVVLPGTEMLVSEVTPFTLSVWLEASPTAAEIQMPVSKPRATDSSLNTLNLLVREDGRIEYEIANASNAPQFFPPVGMPTPSIRFGWHHVAMGWDGTKHTLDLDGVRYQDGTHSRSSSQPVGIGADEDFGGLVYGYTGGIDELRFYDRALEPTEIMLLAQ